MKETTLNILKTLNKYKVIIGIGIGVAIAGGGGAVFFITKEARKTDVAWQSLWKINNDIATAAQQGTDDKNRNAALTTAAEAYKYVRDNISSSSANPWVLYQLGNVYYALKNYDGAITEYKNFLEKYGSHALAPIVKQSLGYAYEEKGLPEEAVRQFEAVLATSNCFLAAQEGWDAGRCYERLGKTDDAIRSYSKTIELSPNSTWAAMAQYRLSAIK